MANYPSFEEIIEAQNKVIQMQYQQWIHHDVFSLQFWLLLILLLLPWFIWWKVVDKKRLFDFLLYGLIVVTAATFLDELGTQLNLWEYKYDIEPLFPRMIPINFTVMPVSYMLLYQYFRDWKSFIKAHFLLAAGFSFIAEPLMVWLDIYKLFGWQHFYSFPLYIILAASIRWLTLFLMRQQTQAKEKTPGQGSQGDLDKSPY